MFVISAFINLASHSSAVSMCLLNLSHSLLFLRCSSLVAVLHHVLVYSFLHMTPVWSTLLSFLFSYRGSSCTQRTYGARIDYQPVWGFPCSYLGSSYTRRTYDARIDYQPVWGFPCCSQRKFLCTRRTYNVRINY